MRKWLTNFSSNQNQTFISDRWRFGVSTPTQYALGFSRFCVSKLALGSDFCEYFSGMDPCRVDTYSVKLASFAVPDITFCRSWNIVGAIANIFRCDWCIPLLAGIIPWGAYSLCSPWAN